MRFSRKKKPKNLPANLPAIPQGLDHNPGITGQAFNTGHPYFDSTSKKALQSVAEYAGYGKEFIKQGFDVKTSAYTVSHVKHGKNELKDNLNTALFLNQEGIKVVLLPTINNGALLEIIPKNQRKEGKFADAWLPDLSVVIDFKKIKKLNYNAIDAAIRSGKNQSDYILLYIQGKIKKGIVKKAIKDRVTRAENIKEIWVFLEGRMYQLKRKDIIKEVFPF